MAFRTWGRLLLTALGVSMLAGAGQLGIAYGFGIVRLTGDFPDVNRWPAQLAWVGWFAVTAAVVGAVLTGRLVRREGLPQDTPVQLAISGAAALGALVVAPLCMQPARAVELSAVDPVWAVGICAVAGAVVGAGAASAVLLRPPLGWNVALLGGAVWLVALVSAAPGVLSTGPLRTVRLGVLEPAWLGADRAQQSAMLLLPVVALVAGAVTGGVARRRGHVPLIGGAAGAAGPVLLAFAYLTAGPGDPGDRYQLAPYYGALIAVATGALGSVAATLLRWPLLPARPTATTGREGDDDTAIEPTDILAPLPTVPAPTRPDPTEAVSVGTDLDRNRLRRNRLDRNRLGGAGHRGAERCRPDRRPRPAGRRAHPGPLGLAGSRRYGHRPADDPPRHPAPERTVPDRVDLDRADPRLARSDRRPTGPNLAGPHLAGPNLAGLAQDEPAPADPAPTGPGRSGPSPARSARAESAPIGAKQRKAATPPPGDEPVAAPKPRVKRTTRTRPAAGVPAADTGRPEPDPATGVGSTEANEPAVTEPAAPPRNRPPPCPRRPRTPTGTAGPGTAPAGHRRAGHAAGSRARHRRPHRSAAAAGALPPVAGLRHVSPDGVERTPRPRHQLPDLSGTGAPADTPRPVPARASLPFPEPDTAEPNGTPGAVSLRWEADGSPTTAPVDGTPAEPASTDPASADPLRPVPTVSSRPARPRAGGGCSGVTDRREGESAAAPTAEPATADDEYVDWVAGLGKPLADNEPERESGRRSLRTSGRHHRD